MTEAIAAVYSGGQTVGRLGLDRAVAVVPRTVDLGTSVGLLRDFLARPRPRRRPTSGSGSRGCPVRPTRPPGCSTSWPADDRCRVGARLAWPHVWPLRVEPEARGPRRGVRDRQGRGQGALAPDYNVAPTKQVYAVRPARPPTPRTSRARPSGSSRTLRWGLVPFWAKDPVDRQQDDQRPHGDRRTRSRPSGGRSRPGAACSRPTATSSGTPPTRRPRPASR